METQGSADQNPAPESYPTSTQPAIGNGGVDTGEAPADSLSMERTLRARLSSKGGRTYVVRERSSEYFGTEGLVKLRAVFFRISALIGSL